MHPKIIWFPVSPGHRFRSSIHAVYVSVIKTNRNRMVQGLCCMVDTSSLQCCGIRAFLALEQPYVANHCLDEEPTVIEVLIVSIEYDQGVFPVPSCNTPYLSVVLEDSVDRPSLGYRRRRPTSLYPLTFPDEPFHPGFATMEPCLCLTFYFRIVMMNPRLIDSDARGRKSGSWEILC